MKYSVVAAVAALQAAVYAQPVLPEILDEGSTAVGPPFSMSSAEAQSIGNGGNPQAASWVVLGAGDVRNIVDENVRNVVDQKIADQISDVSQQVTENLDGRNISCSEDIAKVIGTVGKAAADATADNNATQAAVVMSAIKGVVESTMGNNSNSNIVIGTCAMAAVSGENLEIVIQLAALSINAVNGTGLNQLPGGNQTALSGNDNNMNGTTHRGAIGISNACKNEVCRTGVNAVFKLANLGVNHDVTATFMVALEAIGKYKNVNIKIVNRFAELAVEKIKTLGGNADSKEVADKVAAVTQELKQQGLPGQAADDVNTQVKDAAEECKKIPNKEVPTPGSERPVGPKSPVAPKIPQGPKGANSTEVPKSSQVPKIPEGANSTEVPKVTPPAPKNSQDPELPKPSEDDDCPADANDTETPMNPDFPSSPEATNPADANDTETPMNPDFPSSPEATNPEGPQVPGSFPPGFNGPDFPEFPQIPTDLEDLQVPTWSDGPGSANCPVCAGNTEETKTPQAPENPQDPNIPGPQAPKKPETTLQPPKMPKETPQAPKNAQDPNIPGPQAPKKPETTETTLQLPNMPEETPQAPKNSKETPQAPKKPEEPQSPQGPRDPSSKGTKGSSCLPGDKVRDQ